MPRKRANGEGAITRIKAPGRKPYAAVVTVGWDLEGRPIRKARSASSMREAKERLREMVEARDHHRPLPDDRMTVGKFLRGWITSADVRPNTMTAYRQSLTWALPAIGQIPLAKLRASQVEALLTDLRDRGYAKNSVQSVKAVLTSALRSAMADGYITVNPASVARLPKMTPTRQQAPTTDEVRAVLAALEGSRLRPLFVLLAGTGLRIGEALGLRWEDIDGEPEAVAVGLRDMRAERRGEASGHGRVDAQSGAPAVRPTYRALRVRYQLAQVQGEWVLAPPKTEGRTLHLGPSVVQALREQKARQKEDQMAHRRDWPERGLVFTRPDGEPLARATIKWTLDRACDRAGVRHMTVHDFRRWAATELEDRIGRDAGQLVLGHTTPAMTERYVSTRDSLLRRAADELSEALG